MLHLIYIFVLIKISSFVHPICLTFTLWFIKKKSILFEEIVAHIDIIWLKNANNSLKDIDFIVTIERRENNTYSRQAILSFVYFISDVIKILVPDDKNKTDWKLRKKRRRKNSIKATNNY